jgi:5,10-methylenetetrahydromethanopterin reductase
VRISLHIVPEEIRSTIERAIRAEAGGFHQIWISESHLSVREVFVALTMIADRTKRVGIGPGVTNPVLRDITVTAAALSTIDDVSEGRVICGIGTGDTPIFMLGRRPARLAELRHSIHTIRDLTAGRSVDYHGKSIKIAWARRQLPVYMSAEGPKTLALAGEICDGVFMGSGVDPDVIRWTRAQVGEGAKTAGRSVSEIDLIDCCMVSIDPDPQASHVGARLRVANRAHHNFLFNLDSVPVPERDGVRRLMREFDLESRRDPKYAALVTDYLFKRFCIAGTPAQVAQHFRQLKAQGVTHVMVDLPLRTFDANLAMMIDAVLPAVADASSPSSMRP